MSDPKLKYLGPLPSEFGSLSERKGWIKRVPWSFVIVVGFPTLIAAVYFLLIASPRYVSEAQFVVRAPNANSQPSALGMALQGVGIPTAQADAFAVHEYIKSRDGLKDIQAAHNVARMLGRNGVDFFSRYPRFWESRSEEGLHKGFQRFVVVGYDSTTGISTLRVEAFTAKDASVIAEGLLQGGERLVNRMNERASLDSVAYARNAQARARTRLEDAQARLADFRNQERFLDPELSAKEGSEVMGRLRGAVAELQAQRAQIVSEAPNSPQLAALDARIAGYDAQIAAERSKLAGSAGSLAAKVGVYEQRLMQQELADKEFAQATASLVIAEQDAQRQKLYLDLVVRPNTPDEPQMPQRWLSVLTVLLTSLLAYGIGWLAWAGLREHAQA